MKYVVAISLAVILNSFCFGQTLSAEDQIRLAVLSAPEIFRAEATVYGYDDAGAFVTLRKGSNEMVCLADDPTKGGISVSAYHKDLDAFMARGRTLKMEGKGFQEIFDIREEEVKSGALALPDKSTLYVLTGELDENRELIKQYLRFVVYIPFATAESTGLSTKPIMPGGPWIMDPGTHRAHIMITPPKS